MDKPNFMITKEAYDLEDKFIVVVTEFDYNRVDGVVATKMAYETEAGGSTFNLATLKHENQLWLIEKACKAAKYHATLYYEQAYNHYEGR